MNVVLVREGRQSASNEKRGKEKKTGVDGGIQAECREFRGDPDINSRCHPDTLASKDRLHRLFLLICIQKQMKDRRGEGHLQKQRFFFV